MGQIVSFVVVSGQHILNQLQSEPVADRLKIENRRRRGAALWLRGGSDAPEGSVSVSSIFRESPCRLLSQQGGRLPGGGRSGRPLCLEAVVVSRPQSSVVMSQDSPVLLNVLSRSPDDRPRSPARAETQDTQDSFCSADCCPQCTRVPAVLRRRKVVIPLALTLSIVLGIAGLIVADGFMRKEILRFFLCSFVWYSSWF